MIYKFAYRLYLFVVKNLRTHFTKQFPLEGYVLRQDLKLVSLDFLVFSILWIGNHSRHVILNTSTHQPIQVKLLLLLKSSSRDVKASAATKLRSGIYILYKLDVFFFFCADLLIGSDKKFRSYLFRCFQKISISCSNG